MFQSGCKPSYREAECWVSVRDMFEGYFGIVVRDGACVDGVRDILELQVPELCDVLGGGACQCAAERELLPFSDGDEAATRQRQVS